MYNTHVAWCKPMRVLTMVILEAPVHAQPRRSSLTTNDLPICSGSGTSPWQLLHLYPRRPLQLGAPGRLRVAAPHSARSVLPPPASVPPPRRPPSPALPAVLTLRRPHALHASLPAAASGPPPGMYWANLKGCIWCFPGRTELAKGIASAIQAGNCGTTQQHLWRLHCLAEG